MSECSELFLLQFQAGVRLEILSGNSCSCPLRQRISPGDAMVSQTMVQFGNKGILFMLAKSDHFLSTISNRRVEREKISSFLSIKLFGIHFKFTSYFCYRVEGFCTWN